MFLGLGIFLILYLVCSEDLLFESDGGETAGSTFSSPPVGVTGMQGLGVLIMEGSSGRVYTSNGMVQDGPHLFR